MKKYFHIVCFLLVITGCASKRYTRQALRFEQAGLYEKAAEYYYEAAKRKDSNVEAKLGLRKNGQLALENKLADFMQGYNGANFQDAVYKFREAESYVQKLHGVGVELSIPENYKEYYEEAKGDYLNKKYTDGLDKLNREDFAGAGKVFEEILKIDPNYKDAREKNTIARFEPIYREGLKFLESGYYRKAYYKFNVILSGAGDYKQASVLKADALEKGMITILISEFSPGKNLTSGYAKIITSKVNNRIGSLANPFIKVIDPSGLESKIYENGTLNLQAANLAGIKAVFSGNILELEKKEGKLTKTRQPGYLKEVTVVKNEAGQEVEKITWHKTEYYEYEFQNQVKLNLDYKLVSTENGLVLLSDQINISNSDRAHYAKFDGEKKNLVPGYWKFIDKSSPDDMIKNNQGDINDLRKLLNARQTVKTTDVLTGELMDQAANKIAEKVDKYNPEEK